MLKRLALPLWVGILRPFVFCILVDGSTLMRVFLNVVGLYYGEWVNVEADPTVLDVLEAAELLGVCGSGRLSYCVNQERPTSILWIENDLSTVEEPKSRKYRGGNAKTLNSVPIRLEEGVYNQPSTGGASCFVSVAWQYYIEKLRQTPPKVTTTYSIDDKIVFAGESNAGSDGKKIGEGDTVTLRLLSINTSQPWRPDASPLVPRFLQEIA